jgi:hypothetical protein
MLIVKGYRVAFDLEDGDEILVKPTVGMMHDPAGEDWPKCSLLFGSFRRGKKVAEDEGEARDYFGKDYVIHEGVVDTPERSLSDWKSLGKVERIWYGRPGTRYPGPFQHPFADPGIALRLFKGKGTLPTLYALGPFLRLELAKGCMLDSRGIVWP